MEEKDECILLDKDWHNDADKVYPWRNILRLPNENDGVATS